MSSGAAMKQITSTSTDDDSNSDLLLTAADVVVNTTATRFGAVVLDRMDCSSTVDGFTWMWGVSSVEVDGNVFGSSVAAAKSSRNGVSLCKLLPSLNSGASVTSDTLQR